MTNRRASTGSPKLFVGQSLELAEHVVPLVGESVEKQVPLRTLVIGHTNTPGVLQGVPGTTA